MSGPGEAGLTRDPEEKAKKMTKAFDGKGRGGRISSRQPKTLARKKRKDGEFDFG